MRLSRLGPVLLFALAAGLVTGLGVLSGCTAPVAPAALPGSAAAAGPPE